MECPLTICWEKNQENGLLLSKPSTKQLIMTYVQWGGSIGI